MEKINVLTLSLIMVMYLVLSGCSHDEQFRKAETGSGDKISLIQTGPHDSESDGRIVFEKNCMELHGKPDVIKKVEDPTALEGQAVWIKEKEQGWILQCPWKSSRFIKGITYKVYVRVKSADAGVKEASIGGGIYIRYTLSKGKLDSEVKNVPIKSEGENKWRNICLGDVILGDCFGYVYILTYNAPVLIDSIFAEPIVTEANREYYSTSKKEMEAKENRKRDRLAKIQKRITDHSDLKHKFVYGMVLGGPGFLKSAELTGVPWEWEFRQCIQDLKRHYCNLNYLIAVDAVHPEMYPTAKIMEEEKVYYVSGDVKIIPSIFLVQHSVNEKKLTDFFRKEAPRYKDFNYFLAWSLADEPLEEKLYDYIVGKDIIEHIDTKRPVIPLLNTEEVIEAYGPYQQVMVTDYYTVRRKNPDPWDVGDRVRFCGKYTAGPVWLMYGAYSSAGMRMPSGAEIRVMIYQGLANNATGLGCYLYNLSPMLPESKSSGHPETVVDSLRTTTPVWEEIGRIGKKLVPVGAVIAESEYVTDFPFKVTHTMIDAAAKKRPSLQLACWKKDGTYLLLVFNNDLTHKHTGLITLGDTSLTSARMYNLYDLEMPVKQTEKGIEVSLDPGDGVIFGIGKPASVDQIKKRIYTGRLEQEQAIVALDLNILRKYGLDPTPFEERLQAVKPDTAMSAVIDQIKNDLSDLLENKFHYGTNRKKISKLQNILSDCETLLERETAHKKENIALPLVQKWRQLVQDFGALRYALMEGKPAADNRNADNTTLEAEKLKKEIEGNLP